jgi:hypothetical protein
MSTRHIYSVVRGAIGNEPIKDVALALSEILISIIISIAEDETDAIEGVDRLAGDMRGRVYKIFAERGE